MKFERADKKFASDQARSKKIASRQARKLCVNKYKCEQVNRRNVIKQAREM